MQKKLAWPEHHSGVTHWSRFIHHKIENLNLQARGPWEKEQTSNQATQEDQYHVPTTNVCYSKNLFARVENKILIKKKYTRYQIGKEFSFNLYWSLGYFWIWVILMRW